MAESKSPLFYRRLNSDGTHDSICCGCYLTVATKDHAWSLATEEERHICDPTQRYEVSQFVQRTIDRVDRAIGKPRTQQAQSSQSGRKQRSLQAPGPQ